MRTATRTAVVTAGVLAAVLLSAAPQSLAQDGRRTSGRAAAKDIAPSRIVCWIADGDGMQPTGDLEGFLIDRLSASGDRVAIESGTAHAILRILGLDGRSTFDPQAVHRFGKAAAADHVLWVKLVSRSLESKKLISIPYLLNRRRLDAHVFFDVRLYDVAAGAMIGSKRLQMSDRGEGTWQIVEDEPLDPAYDNDAVEIHNRMRRLDWRAAAAISGYVAGLYRSEKLAAVENVPVGAPDDWRD